MRRITLSFLIALLALMTLKAQSSISAFEFRSVVQPGITIGSHLFSPDTTIDAVALNDSGEMAFLARWKDGDNAKRAAIFTGKRIVALQGDTIDGKYIGTLLSSVAINASGQVAFGAVCSDSKLDSDATIGGSCIVIEKRIAPTGDLNPLKPFTVTDDGRIVFTNESTAPPAIDIQPAASQKKPGLFDRVHIKPPKDLPVSIAPRSKKRQPQNRPPSGLRPPLESFIHPFPVRITNARGQVLVPVNLTPSGFFLLLATPVEQKPQAR